MKTSTWQATVTFYFVLMIPSLSFSAELNQSVYKNLFDTSVNGQLPAGWTVTETVSNGWFGFLKQQSGKLASWKVLQDKNAQDGRKLLAITKINKSDSNVFNIIYTRKIKFKNGKISVQVRADSGEIDQGGGPIWRVKDRNNYYVARYNPLESNFRIYYVQDGSRIQLQSASDIDIKQNEWFEIKIMHKGDHIVGWLNGKKLLDIRDNTHKEEGGVGLWTKADAMSAFDKFSVALE